MRTNVRSPSPLLFLAAFALAGRAHAQASDRWHLTIEPYAWVPTLEGDGSADGSVDVDFDIEYPGGLSAALPLALQLETPGGNTWTLDILYARWEDDQGSIETKTWLGLLDASYGWPVTDTWDFAVGLRAIELGLDVDVGPVDADATESWIDPWFGGRGDVPLGDGWALRARGDVGGFGVGSDFTWQAAGLVGWSSESWRFELGYRALAVRYDQDDLETDLVAHGPILGVAFRL